jgi:hypothetical protein
MRAVVVLAESAVFTQGINIAAQTGAFTGGINISARKSNTLYEQYVEYVAPTFPPALLRTYERGAGSSTSTSYFLTGGTGERQAPAWAELNRSPVDDVFVREQTANTQHASMMARLVSRVAQLKKEGKTERLPWSAASEADFWMYVQDQPRLKEPLVFLTDSGNLRAVWRNEVHEQAAIEFRGYHVVHFVFFAARSQGTPMARSVGQDNLTRITTKISSDGLRELGGLHAGLTSASTPAWRAPRRPR